MYFTSIFALLALGNAAFGHQVAWVKGMYCLGGADILVDEPNTNTAVAPLYNLSKSQWWFQADRGCDKAPPAAGVFLELPAGGSFTVELAINRAFTTLSWKAEKTSSWPDGGQHPENWSGPGNPPDCIRFSESETSSPMHTNNQSMAGGTVFAISYNSDLSDVTMENLVVFTVLPNSPWHRLATYEVPADLPPCSSGGCTCAWGWVPKGCGQPNMYMAGYKCKVTRSKSNRKLAKAQVPKYCPNNLEGCVKGAKQIIAWMQASGDNVVKPNNDFVAYDANWGFSPGAQNDIFVDQCSNIRAGTNISPGSHDIGYKALLSQGECCDYCKSVRACHAFVHDQKNSICYLKDVASPIVGDQSYSVSGLAAG